LTDLPMMPMLIGVTPVSNPAFLRPTKGTISGAFLSVKHLDSAQSEKVRDVLQTPVSRPILGWRGILGL